MHLEEISNSYHLKSVEVTTASRLTVFALMLEVALRYPNIKISLTKTSAKTAAFILTITKIIPLLINSNSLMDSAMGTPTLNQETTVAMHIRQPLHNNIDTIKIRCLQESKLSSVLESRQDSTRGRQLTNHLSSYMHLLVGKAV